MKNEDIPVTRKLLNERCDGLSVKMMPRQKDVIKTSHLDVRELVIDTSGMKEKKTLPDIKEMLDKL